MYKKDIWIVLLLTSISFTFPVASEIYKWTDENGRVHFSDKPHEGAKVVEEIEGKKSRDSKNRVVQGVDGYGKSMAMELGPDMFVELPDGTKYPLPRTAEESKKFEEAVKQATKREEKQHKATRFLETPRQSDITDVRNAPVTRNNPCPAKTEADCNNQDLKGSDYSRLSINMMDFSGSDLTGAKFIGAKIGPNNRFINAKLVNVDFTGVNLNLVDFTGADLTGAVFKNITCHGCIFDNANLTNSVFSGEQISRISFVGANLKGIKFQKPIIHWIGWDLRNVKNFDVDAFVKFMMQGENKHRFLSLAYSHNGCDIGVKEADCKNMDLSGHQFLPTSIENSDFANADLRGADLSLIKSFNGNNLSGANLQEATLPGFYNRSQSNLFIGANLKGAKITGKTLVGDFTNAILDDIDFSGLDLRNAILDGATLKGANIKGAKIDPNTLAKANKEGCALCRKYTDASKVDVQAVIQYLNNNIIAADDNFREERVKRLEKLRSMSKEDKEAYYARIKKGMIGLELLSKGHGIISDEKLVEILHTMLNFKSPRYYTSAFNIIMKHWYKAVEALRVGGKPPDKIVLASITLCGHKKLLPVVLEMTTYKNQEWDQKIDQSPGRSRINMKSTYIRQNAIECLMPLAIVNQQVVSEFINAYPKEEDIEIKRRLLYGFIEKNKSSTLPVLIDTVKNSDIKTSEVAAYQLATWTQPPEKLIPWLVDKYEGNRNVPKAYRELLSSYGDKAKDYLPKLEKYQEERNKNGWKDDGITSVIDSIKNPINTRE